VHNYSENEFFSFQNLNFINVVYSNKRIPKLMTILRYYLKNYEDISFKHIVCSFTYNLDATFYYLNLSNEFQNSNVYLRKEPFSKFWEKPNLCLTTHHTLINDFSNNTTKNIWRKRKTLFLIIEGDYPILSLNLIYSKLSNL